MARTPLLRMFEGLVRDFKEAERSGRTVDEVQQERRLRPTRRDFLKATGAVVGAAALGGRMPAFAQTPRIAIIGGGISGLNAALTLQDARIASTVYEASDHVGGRMHSDTTSWLNGQTSEHCGELIDTSHTSIRGLATRFNLPTVDLHAAEPVHSTETYFFDNVYYKKGQANTDFGTRIGRWASTRSSAVTKAHASPTSGQASVTSPASTAQPCFRGSWKAVRRKALARRRKSSTTTRPASSLDGPPRDSIALGVS